MLTVISTGTALMSEQPNEPSSRHKRRNRSTSPLPYFLVFCCVVIGLFFYFRYQEKLSMQAVAPAPVTQSEIFAEKNTPVNTPVQESQQQDSTATSPSDSGTSQLIENDDLNTTSISANFDETRVFEKPSAAKLSSAQENIEKFYKHLDQQPYMKGFHIPAPSEVYFSTLIQNLLNNPPIVSGETDDLFSILKNTAHFFRIVGKNNILVMKAILDQEKDSFEEVLADYYTLTKQPEYLKKSNSLDIKEDSLYDYAGFFLTTMGGRLYLFRRDSVSRMVVSYYSILIVEEANRQGRNSHGIDIRPAVETLINELENSRAQLKLKDIYLDTLYGFKEKYM